MLVFSVIVFVLLIVSIYINFNLYNKNSVLYEQVDNINQIETQSIDLVENLLLTYIKILTKLKRVDSRGSFESDDEVGFVFKSIKTTIEDLKTELEKKKNKLRGEEIDK